MSAKNINEDKHLQCALVVMMEGRGQGWRREKQVCIFHQSLFTFHMCIKIEFKQKKLNWSLFLSPPSLSFPSLQVLWSKHKHLLVVEMHGRYNITCEITYSVNYFFTLWPHTRSHQEKKKMWAPKSRLLEEVYIAHSLQKWNLEGIAWTYYDWQKMI